MTTKPAISQFNVLADLVIQKYERYLPTAFDENLTILEKVNKVIVYLQETGKVNNDLITQWNSVMEWVMNDGLDTEVNEKLDIMASDGTLDTIINQNVFNGIKGDIELLKQWGLNVQDYADVIINNDWTQAFKDIIASLPSSGGTIIIPNLGYDYEVSSTIEIPSNVSLIGVGNPTIKAKTLSGFYRTEDFDGVTTNIFPVLYAQNASKIRMENITVDGIRTAQVQTNTTPILFIDCDEVKFKEVKAKGNISAGSTASGAFNLFRCTNSLVDECYVDDVQVEGLLLRNCTDVVVKGGEYKNSTSSGVGTQYGSRITIDRVHAHHTVNSCISLNSVDSKVINCNAHDSSAFVGINLGHRTAYETRKPASRSIATDNQVYNCYKGGIYVGYGFDIEIHDNIVYNCRGAVDAGDNANVLGGISPSGWCDRISVKDNKISGCGRGVYGVFSRTDANETLGSRLVVADNEIFDCVWQGIDIYDPIYGVKIEDNTLYRNNVENNNTRAEIRVTCEADLGQVRIVGNMLGEPGVAKGDAIRITWVTDTLGYAVNITDNEFVGYTRTVLASNNNTARFNIKSNMVNHQFVA